LDSQPIPSENNAQLFQETPFCSSIKDSQLLFKQFAFTLHSAPMGNTAHTPSVHRLVVQSSLTRHLPPVDDCVQELFLQLFVIQSSLVEQYLPADDGLHVLY
jgi:hypothetical protein